MRLWHKDLISVLPRQQLITAWRELSAAAGNILTQGTPNHILINKIMDYPLDHFITYAKLVREEMTKRGYRTMDKVWNKIVSVHPNWHTINYNLLYFNWMNDVYFDICYYNLYEKFICYGIESYDWFQIDKMYLKRKKGNTN